MVTATPKDPKVFNALVKQLRTWAEAKEEARAATNAFNKVNTATKELFKGFQTTEAYPAKTAVVVDGVSYTWATATSEVIDPRKWHEMFVKKEITAAQYFDAMSVRKEDAKIAIGEDQVAAISIDQEGSTADIRAGKPSEGTAAKGVMVVLPEGYKKLGGIKPRLAIPSKPAIAVGKPRRVIKIGNRNG